MKITGQSLGAVKKYCNNAVVPRGGVVPGFLIVQPTSYKKSNSIF